MTSIKAPFNEYAGKMISAADLAHEIKNIIREENSLLVAHLRIAFMRPKKLADEASYAIQHFVTFSNNPAANKLVAYKEDGKNTEVYVDGQAICDLVSKSRLSKAKQQTVFKAVGRTPARTT